MTCEADNKGFFCIDNAHIIAEMVIFAGFMGNGNFAAELSVQLVVDLLLQQNIMARRDTSGLINS
jgi:hypothetical protein